MVDDSEINKLLGVYKEMNPAGKKKIVQAAKKLLEGQLLLKDENLSQVKKIENTELKINNPNSDLN